MALNTKYRSIFSGQEIDEAIANMQNSVVVIANDFEGGTTKVASAELAKILKGEVDAITPEYLLTLLQTIPNTHIMTDAEKAKFDKLSTSFRGGFIDATERSVLSPEYPQYQGTELSFILSNADGDPELSRWDTTSNSWVPLSLGGGGSGSNTASNFGPISIPTASNNVIYSFDKTQYSTMKCIVSVSNSSGTIRQVQEVLITSIGSDVHISVYGEVGNSSTLFDLSSSVGGNTVNLIVHTNTTNLTVSASQTALL